MKDQKMQIPWNLKVSGIYAWENEMNGKMYIGKATNLYKRVYDEMHGFRHGKHQNLKKLFNAVQKYGIEKFHVVKLLECPRDCLERIETILIKHFDTKDAGYNCTYGGEGTLGRLVTKAQIAKQKRALQRYWTRDRKIAHAAKMKIWFSKQPLETQKTMKSGNGWWTNVDIKEKHRRNYENAITPEKISKQKKSLRSYYENNPSKRALQISISSPDGKVVDIVGGYKFCRQEHLSYSNMKRLFRGDIVEYQGWKLIPKKEHD